MPTYFVTRFAVPAAALVGVVVAGLGGWAVLDEASKAPAGVHARHLATAQAPQNAASPAAAAASVGGGAVVPEWESTTFVMNPKSVPYAAQLPAAYAGSGSTRTGTSPTAGSPAGAPRVVAGPVLAPPQVRALVAEVFPATEVEHALAVAGCESGFAAGVVSAPNSNGTRDWGLFQFNDGGTLQGVLARTGQDPTRLALALDPDWAVRGAYRLWRERGWQPWTCAAKLGIYRR